MDGVYNNRLGRFMNLLAFRTSPECLELVVSFKCVLDHTSKDLRLLLYMRSQL